MRAFTLVGVVSLVTANVSFMNNALFEPTTYGVQAATYNNASIPYTDENMNCENCVRGGYDFCLFRTFPNETTHGQFTNCTSWAITPEMNSELNVNETDRWICSGAFKDKMQALTSMCANNIEYNRDDDTCGPYLIDLTMPNQVFTQQLIKLPQYKSCTYRLHTKCGFPKVSWFASDTTTDEYDFAFNTIDGLIPSEEGLYNINATTQQGGSMNLQYQFNYNISALQNSVEQTYNGTGLNFFGDYFRCNGMDRNMYVTITRVKVGSSMQVKKELSAEPRVMQAAHQADYLSLVFTNTPGTTNYSGAQALMASLFAVFAICLSLF